jgi:hypothetical protein
MIVQRNVLHGQSKGCWLAIQIGYTRFLFKRWFGGHAQGVHVYIAAPTHDRDKGYRLRRWGIGGRWGRR